MKKIFIYVFLVLFSISFDSFSNIIKKCPDYTNSVSIPLRERFKEAEILEKADKNIEKVRKISDEIRRELSFRSSLHETKILNSTDPVVYDAVNIGGGIHSSISSSNMRKSFDAQNIDASVLVVEAGDVVSKLFGNTRTFNLNTSRKQNDFIGAYFNVEDFSSKEFPESEFFYHTALWNSYWSKSEILFNNKVLEVHDAQFYKGGNKWPAKYRVKMTGDKYVYTDEVLVTSGLGTERVRFKDSGTNKLIKTERSKAVNNKFHRNIETYEDFHQRNEVIAKKGGDPLENYYGKRVGLFGFRHSGFVTAETLIGKGVYPKRSGAKDPHVYVIGAKSKTVSDLSSDPTFVNRYLKNLEDFINDSSARTFVDGRGEKIVKTQKGTFIITVDNKRIEVDKLLLNIGYENNIMNVFSNLRGKKSENLVLHDIIETQDNSNVIIGRNLEVEGEEHLGITFLGPSGGSIDGNISVNTFRNRTPNMAKKIAKKIISRKSE